MKDLADFVALGKEFGFEKAELCAFAQKEYAIYLAKLQEEEEKRRKRDVEEEEKKDRDHERELRLLDRKVKLAEAEQASSGASGTVKPPHVPSFKFSPFNEKNDDLDTWFTLFERQCSTFGVKDKDRKSHLLSLFAGQYREAFLALSVDATYEEVRNSLLQRFNLTSNGYRKKFFTLSPSKNETMVAYSQRLSICFDKWISLAKIDKTFDALKDLLLTHLVLDTCNDKFVSFLLEKEANTVKSLEANANCYFQAHPDEKLGKSSDFPFSVNAGFVDYRGRRPLRDDKFRRRPSSQGDRKGFQGHHRYKSQYQQDEWRDNKNSQDVGNKTIEGLTRDSSREHKFARKKQIRCYRCDKFGHMHFECPLPPPTHYGGKSSIVHDWKESTNFVVTTDTFNGQNDMFNLPECMYKPIDSLACNANVKPMEDQHIYSGFLKQNDVMKPVKVLRDTGSMIHAVHKKFVQPDDYTGKSLSLITFGGKRETFQLARVTIDTPFISQSVLACVLSDYPEEYMYFDVLVGNGDTLGSPKALDPSPEVVQRWEEIHSTVGGSDMDMFPSNQVSVITSDEVNLQVVDTDTDKTAHVSSEIEPVSDIFSNQVQTRGQKSREKKGTSALNDKVLNFDVTYAELADMQKQDKSLSKYFDLVGSTAKKTKSGSCLFEMRNGILVRVFETVENTFVQVLVPQDLRPKILSLGHDMPFSAHMGINRSLTRITSSFYWPGVTVDVKTFCKSCDTCLKTRPKGKTPRVPLQSNTPVIDKPFFKCGTDLIGPLPVTENKNMYVLTLIDYATRWVEAVPLRETTAVVVAEELVKFFSRIGIPSILLSDGGPQFVADIMEAALQLLGIRHNLSTPYHPQTNGLCERVNGTVKSLVKKLARDNPTNWDRYLPCVLFAYREIPQETTGFAPFELVYGSVPRGPLSLLKDLWLQPELDQSTKTTYQYVLDLKQRIKHACRIAKHNTEKQMIKSKERYDSKAKHRQFSVGDQVLLFLPCGSNKLTNEWKGPFTVVETVPGSRVNYVIDIGGKQKTYHINMLQEYTSRPQRLEPEFEIVNNALLAESDCTDVKLHSASVIVEYDKSTAFHTMCVNLLHAANVAMITDKDDCEIDPSGSESFSTIVLPSLDQTEFVEDVKICDDLFESQRVEAHALLSEFSEVFSDVPSKTNCIEHRIVLQNEVPVKLKPYPLPFASEQIVKDEVDSMLKAGVIQSSDSPYASPIVLVKKKDGKVRFCIDFRKINILTVGDAGFIPDQDQLFAKLHKAKYFTKFDMTKGYWQIGIVKECQKYTAFQAGGGLYEFTRMPFGLKNAPATFNRMMEKLLGHRTDVVFYFDDITIFHDDWESHLLAVREILQIFRSNSLRARPKKSVIGYPAITLLGHYVGGGLLKPMPENVEKIINIKVPKSKTQVRSIIGLVNYYSKFLPNLAISLKPLYKLTEKGSPDKIVWSGECQCAIQDIQTKINNNPVLILPDVSKTFFVQTDASGQGLGAALLQRRDGCLRPCFFLSRKLQPREEKYAIIEKECLAIVWALQKLARYLLGRAFVLQTDHKPLKYMQTGRTLNSRICRWTLILQQFDFTVDYITGCSNVVADFLSRNW